MEDNKMKKYEEDLKGMRPLDDDFMRELFRNNIPLAELVLRIILNKPDFKLISLETQYDLKRLVGARSICLDCFGTDDEKKKYDVEIQRASKGAKPKRARYHSSAMDVEFLDAGHDFDDLPETFTIFITESDVFNENQPIYHIERINTTTGKPFGDEEHIIYVNGAYVGDSDIGKLMHDFRCTNADDMYFDLMAERTRYFKETPEGVSYMCAVVENRVNERTLEIALNFLALETVSEEDIAKATGLTIDEVKSLKAQLISNKKS